MSTLRNWSVRVLFLSAALVSVGACGSDSSDDSGANGACEAPKDLGAGFEGCKGGWFHRKTAGTCPQTPASSCGPGCESHPDCGKPYSICAVVGYGGCQCATSCQTDADCGVGKLCACGGDGGVCVTASCTSDADCDSGMQCASYSSLSTCGGGISRYGVLMGGLACQTANDECAGDGDCPSGQRCTLGTGNRVCAEPLPCSS